MSPIDFSINHRGAAPAERSGWQERESHALVRKCKARGLRWNRGLAVAAWAMLLGNALIADELEERRKANESLYADGGLVVTRAEMEDLLRRAELFAADGGYRNATILWSKVLAEGGTALVTDDGETYTPLAARVERAIASLPPAGLQAYRIVADGEAQGLLAQGGDRGREAALAAVVERHFMSSIGDQAAFDLATLHLDRHELVAALRLLERIESRHPDPDVPQSMLQLRIAVAAAGLGDLTKAQAAFDNAVKSRPTLAPELLEAVARYLQSGSVTAAESTAEVPWGMPFGNSRHDGRMPGLPENFLKGDLIVAAAIPLDTVVNDDQISRIMAQFGQRNSGTPDQSLADAVERARTSRWEPAQQALITADGVLVKGARYPAMFTLTESGEVRKVWESLWFNQFRLDEGTVNSRINLAMYGGAGGSTGGPSSPLEIFLYGDRVHQAMSVIDGTAYVVEGQPYAKTAEPPGKGANNPVNIGGIQPLRRARTNWLTAYDARSGKLKWSRPAVDPDTAGAPGNGGEVGGLMLPGEAGENVEASSDDGSGQPEASGDAQTTTPPDQAAADAAAVTEVAEAAAADADQIVGNQDGNVRRVRRAGRMGPAAMGFAPVDLAVEVLQVVGPGMADPGLPGNNPQLVQTGVGYFGSPISVSGVLIAPLTDGGSIHLQAIDPNTGRTLWKTHLCDQPATGAPFWSPIHLAADGQDLYVVCGSGLVFSVGAVDGRIRFARRYQRTPQDGGRTAQANPWGGQLPTLPRFQGWDDDVVIPYQGVVVVAASDCDKLMAFDRTDGRFVWSAPRRPFADAEMRYLIGVRGRYLYAAGDDSLLCYDLGGQGRLVWRELFGAKATGRGCITEDGLYMPVGDSVIRYTFDPIASRKDRRAARVGVRGLEVGIVGNLFSDGRRLWTVSAGRLLALEAAGDRLGELDRRAAEGDLEALWGRARLAMERGDVEQAVSDLEQVLARRSQPQAAAIDRELRELQWLDAALRDPSRSTAAVRMLARVAASDGQQPGVDRDAFLRRRESIQTQLAPHLVASVAETSVLIGWGMLATLIDDADARDVWCQLPIEPQAKRELSQVLLLDEQGGGFALGLHWAEDGQPELAEALRRAIDRTDWPDAVRVAVIERGIVMHDPAALQAALPLLESGSSVVALRLSRVIKSRCTVPLGLDPLASHEARTEAVAIWRMQLGAAEISEIWSPGSVTTPLRFDRLLAGFPREGELVEFDPQGKVLRKHDCEDLVAAAGGPDGDRWIAFPQRLERRSPDDEVIESWDLTGYPKGLVAESDGDLFVAVDGLPGSIQVLAPDGSPLRRLETSGEAIDAICPWDQEQVLVASRVSGRLQCWDRDSRPVDDWPALNVSGLTRLDGGGLLAASSLNATVTEFNESKQVVSRRSGLPQARAAVKTATGLTVVAYAQGLVAFDSDGNEVWSVRDRGPAITLAYF